MALDEAKGCRLLPRRIRFTADQHLTCLAAFGVDQADTLGR